MATLAQLEKGGVGGAGAAQPKPLQMRPPRLALRPAAEERLRQVVNPAYLQPATIAAVRASRPSASGSFRHRPSPPQPTLSPLLNGSTAHPDISHSALARRIHTSARPSHSQVRAQMAEQGAALLSAFLQPAVAAAIQHAANAADRRDGLAGGAMPVGGPPYAAGTRRKGWREVGPPQLRRFLRYRRPKDAPKEASRDEADGGGESEHLSEADDPSVEQRTVGAQLDALRRVMASPPFAQVPGMP